MKVLIAEDETALAKGLKFILEKEHFQVDIVHNGNDALSFFQAGAYDVIVLDIMMPGKDGLEVLRTIRRAGSSVPVMMLTAKADTDDKVEGLESGADDYLAKPFFTKEFVARVKALSRRNAGYVSEKIRYGDVVLCCDTLSLEREDKTVKLNNKEFQLAELFFKNPGRTFSTEDIMDHVWGYDCESELSVVWTTIGFVRKKLKEVGSLVQIKSNRGAGYSLEK